MARGVRKTARDHLELLNAQIQKAEAQLDALYEQREELEKKLREEQALSICRLLEENDLTVDELAKMIEDKKSQEVA